MSVLNQEWRDSDGVMRIAIRYINSINLFLLISSINKFYQW